MIDSTWFSFSIFAPVVYVLSNFTRFLNFFLSSLSSKSIVRTLDFSWPPTGVVSGWDCFSSTTSTDWISTCADSIRLIVDWVSSAFSSGPTMVSKLHNNASSTDSNTFCNFLSSSAWSKIAPFSSSTLDGIDSVSTLLTFRFGFLERELSDWSSTGTFWISCWINSDSIWETTSGAMGSIWVSESCFSRGRSSFNFPFLNLGSFTARETSASCTSRIVSSDGIGTVVASNGLKQKVATLSGEASDSFRSPLVVKGTSSMISSFIEPLLIDSWNNSDSGMSSSSPTFQVVTALKISSSTGQPSSSSGLSPVVWLTTGVSGLISSVNLPFSTFFCLGLGFSGILTTVALCDSIPCSTLGVGSIKSSIASKSFSTESRGSIVLDVSSFGNSIGLRLGFFIFSTLSMNSSFDWADSMWSWRSAEHSTSTGCSVGFDSIFLVFLTVGLIVNVVNKLPDSLSDCSGIGDAISTFKKCCSVCSSEWIGWTITEVSVTAKIGSSNWASVSSISDSIFCTSSAGTTLVVSAGNSTFAGFFVRGTLNFGSLASVFSTGSLSTFTSTGEIGVVLDISNWLVFGSSSLDKSVSSAIVFPASSNGASIVSAGAISTSDRLLGYLSRAIFALCSMSTSDFCTSSVFVSTGGTTSFSTFAGFLLRGTFAFVSSISDSVFSTSSVVGSARTPTINSDCKFVDFLGHGTPVRKMSASVFFTGWPISIDFTGISVSIGLTISVRSAYSGAFSVSHGESNFSKVFFFLGLFGDLRISGTIISSNSSFFFSASDSLSGDWDFLTNCSISLTSTKDIVSCLREDFLLIMVDISTLALRCWIKCVIVSASRSEETVFDALISVLVIKDAIFCKTL